jgi:outer membrane protein
MYKTILATILIFAGQLTAVGQESLTLQETLEIALAQNYDIQVALNNYRMSDIQTQPGNAGLLPRLDLTGGLTLQDVSNSATFQDGQSATSSAALSASYTLFNGMSNWQQFRKLQLSRDSGAWLTRQQIEQSLLEVATAYFNITLTIENRNIMQESLEISRQRLHRLENAARYGQAGSVDLLSARVEMSQDSVLLLQSGYALKQAERDLNLLLNRNPGSELTVLDEIVFDTELDLNRLLQSAEQSNAAYQAVLLNVRTAGLDLAQTRALYLPRLDLQGSLGYSQRANDFNPDLSDPTRTASVGLNASFNLFNGGRNRITRQTTRIARDNSLLQQEEALMQLQSQVTGLLEAFENNRYILRVQQDNLEAVELNFERTLELHIMGQVTSTQMREAQLHKVRTSTGLMEARYNARLSELRLLQVAGRISEIIEIEIAN